MFPLQGELPKTEPQLWRGGTLKQLAIHQQLFLLQSPPPLTTPCFDPALIARWQPTCRPMATGTLTGALPGLPALFVPFVSCAGFVGAVQ